MQITLKLNSAGPVEQLQDLPMLDVEPVRLTGARALAKNCGHVQVVTPTLSDILSWKRASSHFLKLPALHELFFAPTSCIIQSAPKARGHRFFRVFLSTDTSDYPPDFVPEIEPGD